MRKAQEDSEFVWKPTVSVGPFRFGWEISGYKRNCLLMYVEGSGYNTGLDAYETTDGRETLVYAEGGLVDYVACYEQFDFKGCNIIGMRFEDACSLLGVKPDEQGDPAHLSDGPHAPFEFYSLGLELWVKDGVVTAAMASAFIADD